MFCPTCMLFCDCFQNIEEGHQNICNLFSADLGSEKVRDHVTLGVDYALLPHLVWKVLVTWYGLSPGSRAVLLECPLPTYKEQREIIKPLMPIYLEVGDEL